MAELTTRQRSPRTYGRRDSDRFPVLAALSAAEGLRPETPTERAAAAVGAFMDQE